MQSSLLVSFWGDFLSEFGLLNEERLCFQSSLVHQPYTSVVFAASACQKKQFGGLSRFGLWLLLVAIQLMKQLRWSANPLCDEQNALKHSKTIQDSCGGWDTIDFNWCDTLNLSWFFQCTSKTAAKGARELAKSRGGLFGFFVFIFHFITCMSLHRYGISSPKLQIARCGRQMNVEAGKPACFC